MNTSRMRLFEISEWTDNWTTVFQPTTDSQKSRYRGWYLIGTVLVGVGFWVLVGMAIQKLITIF